LFASPLMGRDYNLLTDDANKTLPETLMEVML